MYINKYCNQDDFSVLVCEAVDEIDEPVKCVFKLHGPNFECKKCKNMLEDLYECQTAVIKSYLFVFGGCLQSGKYDNWIKKFCNKTKTCSCKTLPYICHNNIIMCSFEQNNYFIRDDTSYFV